MCRYVVTSFISSVSFVVIKLVFLLHLLVDTSMHVRSHTHTLMYLFSLITLHLIYILNRFKQVYIVLRTQSLLLSTATHLPFADDKRMCARAHVIHTNNSFHKMKICNYLSFVDCVCCCRTSTPPAAMRTLYNQEINFFEK